jgi:hypothetical protein
MHSVHFALSFASILILNLSIYSQPITGSAEIQLSGPASSEQMNSVKEQAANQFKSQLVEWLSQDSGFFYDSTNILDNFNVNAYLNSCKGESSITGKKLSFKYSIKPETAESLLIKYNEENRTKAFDCWTKIQTGLKDSNITMVISEGIKALAYVKTQKPLVIPGTENVFLSDSVKNILTEILNKLSVTSSDVIIKGRTGQICQNPPVISINFGNKPVEGIGFTGFLPDGRKCFSASSDSGGNISFSTFKIPFIPNGALLIASFNPGLILGADFIDINSFGLKLKKNLDQSFIFKTARLTYTLKYSATSASALPMPADFSSNSHIQKFLKDSCFLDPATPALPADIDITISTQVSSYTYDESEETSIKFNTNVIVKGISFNPPRTKSEGSVFEKRFESKVQIPYGMVFWEAAGKIRELVLTTLKNM